MTATINNLALEIKEYKGIRVVTFGDIDRVHERTDGTASRVFRANRERFIEGEDYFNISKNQSDEIRRLEIPNRGIIVLTEFGYLLLVKSLTDKLAWRVQRELVKGYFRAKEQQQQQLTTGHPLLEQSVYHLQQSQQYTTNALLENAYEIGELKAKYATAQAEIKALKSQATRTERKLNNHLKNKPTITYFGDIEALYNNMSDIYQSFTTCYNVNGEKNTNGRSTFRIVEFDGDRLTFRTSKYNNNRMFVDNIVKAERIDNHNGHYSASRFRLYLGDITSVIELEAVRKAEGSGYKLG